MWARTPGLPVARCLHRPRACITLGGTQGPAHQPAHQPRVTSTHAPSPLAGGGGAGRRTPTATGHCWRPTATAVAQSTRGLLKSAVTWRSAAAAAVSRRAAAAAAAEVQSRQAAARSMNCCCRSCCRCHRPDRAAAWLTARRGGPGRRPHCLQQGPCRLWLWVVRTSYRAALLLTSPAQPLPVAVCCVRPLHWWRCTPALRASWLPRNTLALLIHGVACPSVRRACCV